MSPQNITRQQKTPTDWESEDGNQSVKWMETENKLS